MALSVSSLQQQSTQGYMRAPAHAIPPLSENSIHCTADVCFQFKFAACFALRHLAFVFLIAHVIALARLTMQQREGTFMWHCLATLP